MTITLADLKVKGRILLVEDEADVRQALTDVFQCFGMEIVTAVDGEKALHRLKKVESYHLIVSDIRMPKMDGLQLFEAVRSLGIESPFVFLTACDDKERIIEAMRLGAFDYIEKPFNANELESVIEIALDVGIRQQRIAEIKTQLAENTTKSPAKAVLEMEHLQKVIQMMRVNNQRKRKAA